MSAYTVAPPDQWSRMKDDYLCGATADDLCRRHGVSRSQFYAHARREGWRRADHPGGGGGSAGEGDDGFDLDAPAPAPEALVETAWRRAAHATQRGRLREARGWTRLTRDLRLMARPPADAPAPPRAPADAPDALDQAVALARSVGEIARAAAAAAALPPDEQADAVARLDALTTALERAFAPAALSNGADAAGWAGEPDTPDGFSMSDRRGRQACVDPAGWRAPDAPDGLTILGPGFEPPAGAVAAAPRASHIQRRQGDGPMFFKKVLEIPTPDQALPGRAEAMATAKTHYVNGQPLKGPYPEGLETAEFGMGCFWGVERIFWQVPGVYVTAVGYSGGVTPNPSYEEVCSGRTGQNETVLVVFDPKVVSYAQLLKTFWEGHNPTQGMRQGNDSGTQYRSAIYTHSPAQAQAAQASRAAYQPALSARGYGEITTEIKPAGAFYFAEGYHQQYLAKNPGGYCGIGGTGVDCPAGLAVPA